MTADEGGARRVRTFVNGLGQDHDAVVAGQSLLCSSGDSRATTRKIKMLQRQMLGRANFELLRKRVFLTVRRRS